MDLQSRAFREAEPFDWREVDDLEPVPDHHPVRTVEEWERVNWDAGRLQPKTLDQARHLLAARVADPAAPDTDPAAYDADDPDGRQHTLGPVSLRNPVPRGAVRALWIVDAARSMGLRVVLVPGWELAGHGAMRVIEGVVGHHTATPDSAGGDYPSLRVVRDGRAGLAGPLCNLGLGRDGTVYAISAGVGYHAGASQHAGFVDLNDEFLGIEAEDNGDGRWTAAQLDAYPRLVAGLLKYMRRGVDRYVSHRGCCRPAGRKPDPAGITDAWMREHAGRHLVGAPTPDPTPPAPPAPPTRKGENMIQNFLIEGRGDVRLGLPVGPASAITEGAWISFLAKAGPVSAHVWFQSDTGGISDKWLNSDITEGRAVRSVVTVPVGTTQVNIQYDAPGGATVVVETLSR